MRQLCYVNQGNCILCIFTPFRLLYAFWSACLAQELWCKKGPPTAELISHFPPQPPLPLTPAPLPPVSAAELERLRPLTSVADQLGILLQNHHQVRRGCHCRLPN